MDEDKVSMTKLCLQAFEDQTNLADVTNAEAVKFAFTEGVKHGSEKQTHPIHSSHMELEIVCHVQKPIMTSGEYGLNAVHLIRPATGNAMGTLMVNNAIHIQQAAKLQVFSTHYGDIEVNKTFQSVASFNTGKRYKRETNLKFSEGSVEQYKSFRSQFNIHHKILG